MTPHMQNLKETIQINLFTKQKQTHRLREQTYGPRWEGVGRDSQRVRERGAQLTVTSQHRDYTLLPGSLDGRGRGGEWKHVHVWLSPFTVHIYLSQHCLLVIPQ